MSQTTLPSKLQKFLRPNKVFIFSKSYCSFCSKAKNLFKDLGIKYNSIEVDDSPELQDDDEFIEVLESYSGMKTYPKIFFGYTCIGGYSELNILHQNSKLEQLLKKENILQNPKF